MALNNSISCNIPLITHGSAHALHNPHSPTALVVAGHNASSPWRYALASPLVLTLLSLILCLATLVLREVAAAAVHRVSAVRHCMVQWLDARIANAVQQAINLDLLRPELRQLEQRHVALRSRVDKVSAHMITMDDGLGSKINHISDRSNTIGHSLRFSVDRLSDHLTTMDDKAQSLAQRLDTMQGVLDERMDRLLTPHTAGSSHPELREDIENPDGQQARNNEGLSKRVKEIESVLQAFISKPRTDLHDTLYVQSLDNDVATLKTELRMLDSQVADNKCIASNAIDAIAGLKNGVDKLSVHNGALTESIRHAVTHSENAWTVAAKLQADFDTLTSEQEDRTGKVAIDVQETHIKRLKDLQAIVATLKTDTERSLDHIDVLLKRRRRAGEATAGDVTLLRSNMADVRNCIWGNAPPILPTKAETSDVGMQGQLADHASLLTEHVNGMNTVGRMTQQTQAQVQDIQRRVDRMERRWFMAHTAQRSYR